jgi:hypothetical protein
LREQQHRQKLLNALPPRDPQDLKLQQLKLAVNKARVDHVVVGVVAGAAAEVGQTRLRNRKAPGRWVSRWKARSMGQRILMVRRFRHLK